MKASMLIILFLIVGFAQADARVDADQYRAHMPWRISNTNIEHKIGCPTAGYNQYPANQTIEASCRYSDELDPRYAPSNQSFGSAETGEPCTVVEEGGNEVQLQNWEMNTERMDALRYDRYGQPYFVAEVTWDLYCWDD